MQLQAGNKDFLLGFNSSYVIVSGGLTSED